MATQLPTRKAFLANGILEDVNCALCKKSFSGVQKAARIRTANHECRYVFGSACLHEHFANRTNNQCPECKVPLFTMPRIPNAKPGARIHNNIPAETWDQGSYPTIALLTADQFNSNTALEFVQTVWYNVNQLYPNTEIYESDIEERITDALEAIRVFDPDVFTRPLIKFEHCGPVKGVVKEMIREQFENAGDDNLTEDELYDV